LDYPDIIQHPMDLRTAREKVRAGAYSCMAEWHADMQRIWDNCRTYNPKGDPVILCADKLEALMQRRMEEAVAAAARELSAAQQQRADAGGLAGESPAGVSKPRVPREVALMRANMSAAGSGSDGGGDDGVQATPEARAVSSGVSAAHH
jgi:hypothetical protein